MENSRQIRASRTSLEQLEAYVSFLEGNPQFNAGKNTPENTKYLDEKWQELAGKLNILKGPLKSGKEWKASLTHWKYQLKSRARKIREEILITGDGQSTTTSMSRLEERALHLFGILTVRGDNDIPVMGFQNTNHIDLSTDEETNDVTASSNVNIMTPSMQTDPMPRQSIATSSSQNTTPTPRKRQYNSFSSGISECVEKIGKLADDRAKQERDLAEQRLAIEKQNADALTRMAEALYVLANAFKNK